MTQTQEAKQEVGLAPTKKLEVVIAFYPGVTMQDYIGPSTILGRFSNVRTYWKCIEPVISDIGLISIPHATYADCPEHVDILLVPGGPNTLEVVKDEELLSFLKTCGARARYITSVCSGALLLGAAGLLDGYKATTHWAVMHLLEQYGAIPVKKRVVEDRNRFSGGGVTAGIDFGLTLIAKILGDDHAKIAQLIAEYDPQPPFNAGSPETAGPDIVAKCRQMLGL